MQSESQMRGRPPRPVAPTEEERETLKRWSRGLAVYAQLVQHGKIVLLCADGKGTGEVAVELGVTQSTVSKWRKRFALHGVDGLSDLPRPKTSRRLSDEKVEELIRTTLETTPPGQTHWSSRQLAKKIGVSQSSVSRVWRAFELKPHRQESFRLSNDDFFVEKVRDVVGLYMNPPDNAMVLCVDEKSQIQALERGQPVIPMLFGQPKRRTPQYLRHGTTTLFAAQGGTTGCRPPRISFAGFLRHQPACAGAGASTPPLRVCTHRGGACSSSVASASGGTRSSCCSRVRA